MTDQAVDPSGGQESTFSGRDEAVKHQDQHEEDDAEALELALGLLGEELLHPHREHLHEHDVAAAEEEHAHEQRDVEDVCRVDVLRPPEQAEEPDAEDAQHDGERRGKGKFVFLQQHRGRDDRDHAEQQPHALDDADVVRRIAEIVDQIVADVRIKDMAAIAGNPSSAAISANLG